MNIDEKVITKLDNFVQILFDVRGKKEKKTRGEGYSSQPVSFKSVALPTSFHRALLIVI